MEASKAETVFGKTLKEALRKEIFEYANQLSSQMFIISKISGLLHRDVNLLPHGIIAVSYS